MTLITSDVLAWRIPGTGGSLVGCRLWGRTELDTTEATGAAAAAAQATVQIFANSPY